LANPYIFLFCLVLIALFFLLRKKFGKITTYNFTLVSFFQQNGIKSFTLPYYLDLAFRLTLLGILAFLIGKPQFVKYRTPTKVDGVDIVLLFDVSQSMNCFDDLKDRRTRFEVAQEEAIRFIDKRASDAIGLVIFAKDAVTRSPLTLDKNMLKSIISDMQIGIIDGTGTAISSSLLTGANRLKKSKAKSKVMILLTDGQPTVKEVPIGEVIKILNMLNIKVYTIGIGAENGGYFNHPFLGLVSGNNSLNLALLEKIALETGGHAFLAQSPTDMKNIYDQIDSLEKTVYETDMYCNYIDWFISLLILSIGLILMQLIISTFVWFVL
jgi:Ca-activated chloride channel homolog